MDELFERVSRPSNLQCHWQVGWPTCRGLSSVRLTNFV